MAEKTKLKKLMEKIRNYEEEERFEIKKALYSGCKFTEEQMRIMDLVFKNQLHEHYGLLTLLYNCYSKLESELPREERLSERFFALRWDSYMKAYSKWTAPKQPVQGIEKHLEREALRVLSSNVNERGESFSDFFNASMMIKDWGEDIRYCSPWKKWLIWDGCRWNIDELREIYDMGKLSIEAMVEKAPDCPSTDDGLNLIAHSRRSSTARKVDAMLSTTSSDPLIRIAPDALDQDQFLFNCSNGVIDLKSGRLSPHDRERMITKYSPVPYNEEALCPHWKQFLKDIFDNNKELIKFIQRFLGCSLTGDMSSQSMFILYGTGANGKSTFINVVSRIMGDYATTTPTETFMQKKGEQATNDIARLKGARFVTAMESDDHGRLAESVIKRLTGNDMISARFLYGEYFQFTPTFKIVMATNHKPRIGGMDHAIWRRIKLIPFEATFTEEKQDKKLTGKLVKEMPGILSWMVEGCLRWQKEGLGSALAIKDATDEYRNQMSDVQMFLAEKCELDEDDMIQSSLLYGEYTAWCEENHERPKSNRNFSMMLSESGMDKVRLSAGIFWLGIKKREEKPY
jgi:putative DNA primase/helicase